MEASETRPVIMAVDDVPANTRLLGGILRAQGYVVREYPNGPLALAAAAEHHPDLILLDIMMPDMNGYAVCERLKADPALAEIPVIFLSSLSDTTDKVKAFSVGGVDYITKPFQPNEVQARVEAHLKIRQLQVALERKNLELSGNYDRLRELETLRDNLVHMIIHDLRNPLQGIMTFSSLLEDAEKEHLTERGQGYLRKIINATDFLVEMISGMLDVSKLEAGRMELHLEDVDLGAVAREAVARLEAVRGERQLVLDPPAQPVLVRGDALLLSRLILNLVGNALKFTPERTGRVGIAIAAEGPWVRLSVRDNGPGIPPEHQEKVFDKFWQGEARQRGFRYSTGLGLTFCKMVVEAHGGRIGVASEVGRGSTFWFSVPKGGPAFPGRVPTDEGRTHGDESRDS